MGRLQVLRLQGHIKHLGLAQVVTVQGLFTLFCPMRCESKRPWARRVMAAGVHPGKMTQRGPRPFWPQPEGNPLKKTPLVVAGLAQAASLGVVLRLDWRFFKGFALAKQGEQALAASH